MQRGWILAAVVVAGHMAAQPAAAVPVVVGKTPAPPGPDLVLVQSGESAMVSDRMQRLWQHRAIIENALAPRRTLAPRPPEAQTQPLEPPVEDIPPQPDVAGEPGGLVDCEAAADIVADYGFSDVRLQDCTGDVYTFSAMRDGTAYALSVTSDGEISEVSRQ